MFVREFEAWSYAGAERRLYMAVRLPSRILQIPNRFIIAREGYLPEFEFLSPSWIGVLTSGGARAADCIAVETSGRDALLGGIMAIGQKN